jgi:hypothetical protein
VGDVEQVRQGDVQGRHEGMPVGESVRIVVFGHWLVKIQDTLVIESLIIAYPYLHTKHTLELLQVTQLRLQLVQIPKAPAYIPVGQPA